MGSKDITKGGKVRFLTPVPYYSSPELRKRGLVIVDLEQLVEAQKKYDEKLSDWKKKVWNYFRTHEYGSTNPEVDKAVKWIYKTMEDDLLKEV